MVKGSEPRRADNLTACRTVEANLPFVLGVGAHDVSPGSAGGSHGDVG
ncbi:hypothetical protein ACFLV4_06940 [Chloroflexota bacterium]